MFLKAMIILLIFQQTKTWHLNKESPFKRQIELNPYDVVDQKHYLTDCIQVAMEPGEYIFNPQMMSPPPPLVSSDDNEAISQFMGIERNEREDFTGSDLPTCGLYLIGDPDTIVEVVLKHYDVRCEKAGLMAFVDGWELNGEYFPSPQDHPLPMEQRVTEFCNAEQHRWTPFKDYLRQSQRRLYRSSQNAALLQYRLPPTGYFMAEIRFHKIHEPCNILASDTLAVYHLANYGYRRNCSIAILFPAVITITQMQVGKEEPTTNGLELLDNVNPQCLMEADRLEIGGSFGLDTTQMEIVSTRCGISDVIVAEESIFCGVASVRLVSSGRFENSVDILVRQADSPNPLSLICNP